MDLKLEKYKGEKFDPPALDHVFTTPLNLFSLERFLFPKADRLYTLVFDGSGVGTKYVFVCHIFDEKEFLYDFALMSDSDDENMAWEFFRACFPERNMYGLELFVMDDFKKIVENASFFDTPGIISDGSNYEHLKEKLSPSIMSYCRAAVTENGEPKSLVTVKYVLKHSPVAMDEPLETPTGEYHRNSTSQEWYGNLVGSKGEILGYGNRSDMDRVKMDFEPEDAPGVEQPAGDYPEFSTSKFGNHSVLFKELENEISRLSLNMRPDFDDDTVLKITPDESGLEDYLDNVASVVHADIRSIVTPETDMTTAFKEIVSSIERNAGRLYTNFGFTPNNVLVMKIAGKVLSKLGFFGISEASSRKKKRKRRKKSDNKVVLGAFGWTDHHRKFGHDLPTADMSGDAASESKRIFQVYGDIYDRTGNHLVALMETSLKTGRTIDEILALLEVAPPGKKAEEFIKSAKKDFKKRYGKRWKEILYSTAWKKFGKKKKKKKSS